MLIKRQTDEVLTLYGREWRLSAAECRTIIIEAAAETLII